jgi:preprotein translocase subunit SecA
MDDLRRSVSLRGYGQRDPLVEYKREAFEMFSDLMVTIKSTIVRAAFRSTTNFETFMASRARNQHRLAVVNPAEALKKTTAPSAPSQPKPIANFTVTVPGLEAPVEDTETSTLETIEAPSTPASTPKQGSLEALMQNLQPGSSLLEQTESTPSMPTKVGRNDACPCGSGKKYKVCCGR